MSDSEVPSHFLTPVGAGPAPSEEHELPQIQEQYIQSPVRDTDAKELKEDWRYGLCMTDRLEARQNDFTKEDREKAWKPVNEAVKTYSDEMIQRWIAEIDTLLVCAGLFSVVLIASNIESYPLLSTTPPDQVLLALSQISAQLASFSVHESFVNSTQPAYQSSFIPSNSTSPERWAVWLNALWFSSLICSLSAAFVSLMVKQWLYEYKAGISGFSGFSRNTARLRQHLYNGLVNWKVATIIAVLPILLQIASGLFLAGLLVLLWNLNQTVAIVASALVGTLLAFTLVTIILPTITSNCAYLSPLSIFLFRFGRLLYTPIATLIYNTAHSVYNTSPQGSTLKRISYWLWQNCPYRLEPSIHAMQSAHVTRNPGQLDQDIFITAYSTTGDTVSLLEHASTCFSNHSIENLSQFLTRIHTQNMDHGQTASGTHWTHYIPLDMASDMLLVMIRNMSSASGETSGQPKSCLQGSTPYYLACSDHADGVPGARSINYMLSNMAAVLYNDGERHPDGFPLYQCLAALRRQMNHVKESQSALTDDVRRHVLAAILTVVRTSTSNELTVHHDVYLEVLISCSSPNISRSQPGDMAEEYLKREPFTDAIALAEDALIMKVRSPDYQHGDSAHKCLVIEFFCDYFQHFDPEQLASRVSDKMLRALEGAVQGLNPNNRGRHDKAWKLGLLEWLNLLERKRDKQMSMQATGETDERKGHGRYMPEERSMRVEPGAGS